MQSDDVIWGVISTGHCSFKVKTVTKSFCRNSYNVTGLCNRSSCPLANSRYATIKTQNGIVYLYIKTIERAHMPSKLWERIKLSQNFATALEQVDRHLIYWPEAMKHRTKLRFTRIYQYLIRMRRLTKKVDKKIVPLNKKIERREIKKERRALVAAKINSSIEKELVERLKQGTYEGIANFPQNVFHNALDSLEADNEAEADVLTDEDEEDDEELEEEPEFVEGDEADEDIEGLFDDDELGDELRQDDDDDDEDEDDDDDADEPAPPSASKRKPAPSKRKVDRKDVSALQGGKRAKVTIQYEKEHEHEPRKAARESW